LTHRGWNCWRQNQIRVPGRKFIGRKGQADIIGFNRYTGLFMACEVKTAGDILSNDQKVFLMELKHAGGISLIAEDDGKGGVIIKKYDFS
jgi:hypothetical protein